MASNNKMLMIILLALFGLVARATDQKPSSSCQEQINKMQWSFCNQWFTNPYPSRYEKVSTPPPFLAECCGEVGKISSTCRCEAIRYMFSTYHSSRNVLQVKAKVNDLPRRCQWKSPTQCHIA